MIHFGPDESSRQHWIIAEDPGGLTDPDYPRNNYPAGYFWMHVTFVWLFTGLVLFFLNDETKKIIKVRQEYLGSQSTVTDRTFRLSGIPTPLQSEARLKEFIERLEIGKVETITICSDWSELDNLMSARVDTLRKLEEYWATYLKQCEEEGSSPSAWPISRVARHNNSDSENSPLLNNEEVEHSLITSSDEKRPKTRIRYGFLHLQSTKVDAIDYYEAKLRRLDEKIKAVRQKNFDPTPLAFVTMDSIAACVGSIVQPRVLRADWFSKWLYKLYWIHPLDGFLHKLLQPLPTLFGPIRISPARTVWRGPGPSPCSSAFFPWCGRFC